MSRICLLPRAILSELRRIFLTDRDVLLVLLAIPVVYPTIVSELYERTSAMERPLVVVDLDNSEVSRRLSLALDATPELELRRRVDDVETGRRTLRDGEAEVLVRIPDDFSRRVARGEPAAVKAWIGAANMLTYGVAYPGLRAAIGALNEEITTERLQKRGFNTAGVRRRVPPVVQESRLLYHPTASYGGFLIIGVLLLVVQQMVLVALAFSVGRRREPGRTDPLFERAPFVTTVGAYLAQSLLYAAGTAVILFVIAPAFGWPMQRPAAMFLLFLAFIGALAPLAVLIALAVRDGTSAFQLLMFATIPLLMMSGFAWPLDQMPAYVRAIASVLPSTPALQAVRLLSTKTGDLSVVLPLLRWLAVQSAAYALVLVVVAAGAAWRRARRLRAALAGPEG